MTKFYYGSINKKRSSPRIITIGNFDGVHLGHQTILRFCINEAKKNNIISSVITFHPHPKIFFNSTPPQEAIHTLRDKATEISKLNIDEIFFIPFNLKLSKISPTNFIKELLIDKLNMKIIVVGRDFKFGSNRSGDIELLKKLSNDYGFKPIVFENINSENQRISSTRLRYFAKIGLFSQIIKSRGENLVIRGRVIHGKKLGRTLDYPTLNIKVPKNLCFSGIFGVMVSGVDKSNKTKKLPGVASLGKRPTIERDGNLILEVYILDWNKEIYGNLVNIEIVDKIRDEKKFESLDDLKKQMIIDETTVREKIFLNEQ